MWVWILVIINNYKSFEENVNQYVWCTKGLISGISLVQSCKLVSTSHNRDIIIISFKVSHVLFVAHKLNWCWTCSVIVISCMLAQRREWPLCVSSPLRVRWRKWVPCPPNIKSMQRKIEGNIVLILYKKREKESLNKRRRSKFINDWNDYMDFSIRRLQWLIFHRQK